MYSRKSYFLVSFVIAVLYFLVGCKGKSTTATEQTVTNQRDDTAGVISKKGNEGLDTAGYKVYQSFQPQMVAGSKQVTVYIMQDERLAGPIAKVDYFPALHAAQLVFNSDEAIFDNTDGLVYKPAILVIKDNGGTVISHSLLEVTTARLDTAYLDEKQTNLIYLFTMDYSIGWGSYAGPTTYFVRFADTGLVNYNSSNAFASTLKTGWAIRYTDNGIEVLHKMCRSADNDNFSVTTERAVWRDDAFKITRSTKKGFWENEGGVDEFFDSFRE